MNSRIHFLFLNIGHFLDHYFMLIFATAAALRLSSEWGLSYAQLIPYATPGFIAFGICAIPAGWLADKWSRSAMMSVFFVGIGLSAVFCGFAQSPMQIAIALTLVGVFAAIYHPVGIAMVIQDRGRTGIPIAINGVFGNMGVASAALITGFLIDTSGWRNAFIFSGLVSIIIGLLYFWLLRSVSSSSDTVGIKAPSTSAPPLSITKAQLLAVFSIILFTTALGGLIFQSTTFALPKVFDENLSDLASSATEIGWYAFFVFSAAAFAQLLVGYLVDKFQLKYVFAVVAALQCVLFALMISQKGIASLLVALLFMLAVFGQIPINDVLLGRITRSEWRSRAFALRYLVTFSVMASAVPLIAWIHSGWGFDRLFLILSCTALLIFLATLLLPLEKRPQSVSG